jgi:hypothetical protein
VPKPHAIPTGAPSRRNLQKTRRKQKTVAVNSSVRFARSSHCDAAHSSGPLQESARKHPGGGRTSGNRRPPSSSACSSVICTQSSGIAAMTNSPFVCLVVDPSWAEPSEPGHPVAVPAQALILRYARHPAPKSSALMSAAQLSSLCLGGHPVMAASRIGRGTPVPRACRVGRWGPRRRRRRLRGEESVEGQRAIPFWADRRLRPGSRRVSRMTQCPSS